MMPQVFGFQKANSFRRAKGAMEANGSKIRSKVASPAKFPNLLCNASMDRRIQHPKRKRVELSHSHAKAVDESFSLAKLAS